MLVPSGMRALYNCTQETYNDHVLLDRYEVRQQQSRVTSPTFADRMCATTSTNASMRKPQLCKRYQRQTPVACQQEEEPSQVSSAGSLARRPGRVEFLRTFQDLLPPSHHYDMPLDSRRIFNGENGGCVDGNRALLRDAASRAD